MPAGDFRWNDWNRRHATKHGCTIQEIQSVVRNAGHGYPRKSGDGKQLVIGRGVGGRFIRVLFVYDPDRTMYVIHAMPLTTRRRR
jgi:uncharacterized DUF497 family protein